MSVATRNPWNDVIGQRVFQEKWGFSSISNRNAKSTYDYRLEVDREVVAVQAGCSLGNERKYSSVSTSIVESASPSASEIRNWLYETKVLRATLGSSFESTHEFPGAVWIGTVLEAGHGLPNRWICRLQESNIPNPLRVNQTLEHMANSHMMPYRDSLLAELAELQQMVIEEDEDEGIKYAARGINPESLSYFLKFLRENSDLKKPSMTVTPDKFLSADWRESNRKLCTVYFLPNGKIRYLVFSPDPNAVNGFDRHSGLTDSETFAGLRANLPLEWMVRE